LLRYHSKLYSEITKKNEVIKLYKTFIQTYIELSYETLYRPTSKQFAFVSENLNKIG